MFLLTWPYVEHHNLRVRFVALTQAHYPGILRRIKAAFNFLKKLGVYLILIVSSKHLSKMFNLKPVTWVRFSMTSQLFSTFHLELVYRLKLLS